MAHVYLGMIQILSDIGFISVIITVLASFFIFRFIIF